jgi:hypothetical protein
MMVTEHLMRLVVACGLAAGAVGSGYAQESMQKSHVPLAKTIGQAAHSGPIPSLAVINAQGARLEGNQLTLTGVSPSSIVFADRPVRAAGHVPITEVITEWAGSGTFAKDPPNATVSVLGSGSSVSDAVVTLRSAKLEGNDLVFDVAVLEGNLTGATGPAALVIDRFGWGWRGRGAWYAGAAAGAALGIAAGAAAASPYYYPPYPAYPPYPYTHPMRCGYYPYPPCY